MILTSLRGNLFDGKSLVPDLLHYGLTVTSASSSTSRKNCSNVIFASLIENEMNHSYGRMLIESREHSTNLQQDKTKDTYDLKMGFIKVK